jgi:hypothetical protein
MAPGISYDESGSLANYFGVTFLALILVPTTYLVLKPQRRGELFKSLPLIHVAESQKTCNHYASARNANVTQKS